MSNNHGQKIGGKNCDCQQAEASRIGLATAKRFVEEGAHVVITGRREKELEGGRMPSSRETLRRSWAMCRAWKIWDRLYAVVKEKHDHIDILSSRTRARGQSHRFAVATEAHFDQTFDVNVKGMFFTVQKGPSPSSKTEVQLS